MRTQVGIVGAGPAGLLLAQLLATTASSRSSSRPRSREYVEARIRAGVLEAGTVELLRARRRSATASTARAWSTAGIYLQWPGERHRLDFVELSGRSVVGLRADRGGQGPGRGARQAGGQPLVLRGRRT